MRAYDTKLARQQERIAQSPQMRAQRARLLAALSPSAGERVLEVGCGNGHVTAELADIAGPSNVAAVDPSVDRATLPSGVLRMIVEASAARSRREAIP